MTTDEYVRQFTEDIDKCIEAIKRKLPMLMARYEIEALKKQILKKEGIL